MNNLVLAWKVWGDQQLDYVLENVNKNVNKNINKTSKKNKLGAAADNTSGEYFALQTFSSFFFNK